MPRTDLPPFVIEAAQAIAKPVFAAGLLGIDSVDVRVGAYPFKIRVYADGKVEDRAPELVEEVR